LSVRMSNVADYLLDIIVGAGVVHHVKDGNEGVFVCVPERAAVHEMVAPGVKLLELFQLT
jgi:DNA-binding cell septation regulator SpoVG